MAIKLYKGEDKHEIMRQWEQLAVDIKRVMNAHNVTTEYGLRRTMKMDRRDAQATLRIMAMENRPGSEILQRVCSKLGLRVTNYPNVGSPRNTGGRKPKQRRARLPVAAADAQKIGDDAGIPPDARIELGEEYDPIEDLQKWIRVGEEFIAQGRSLIEAVKADRDKRRELAKLIIERLT